MQRNSVSLNQRRLKCYKTHDSRCVSRKVKDTVSFLPTVATSLGEMPTPKLYWEEMTLRIAKKLKSIGVSMLDCYLVGSGMSSPSLADIEDIDSAMILTGNYSDEEMLIIRDGLDTLLLKVDTWSKYHFRLFDEIGFRRLAVYDGYRLYEFREDNLSFCNTDILHQSEPILNSENFTVSYLTQLVYDCLMNRDIFKSAVVSKKATDRLKRNVEINKINAINGIGLDANAISSMLDDFWKLRDNSNQSISEWQQFLSSYYSRMTHEFINKSNRYKLNLRGYLCR